MTGFLQKTCSDDPTACTTVADLCEKASYYTNGIKKWSTLVQRSQHVKEAKRRGLNCGTQELTSISDANICLKATELDVGVKYWIAKENKDYPYVMEAKRRSLNCTVDDTSLVNYSKYISGSGTVEISAKDADGFFSWRTGNALYADQYNKLGKTVTSNSNSKTVFPPLYRLFKNLSKSNKFTIQRNLKAKGLYNSAIDGLWGHNTLVGIVEYASVRLKMINLKSESLARLVIEQILADDKKIATLADPTILKLARNSFEKDKQNKADNDYLSAMFKLESSLKRKQIQYAMRNLGFYSSSIDGLWGAGTLDGLTNYSNAHGLTSSSPRQIFNSLLNKVDVPKSFHVPNKKTISNNRQSSGCVSIASALTGIDALCSKNPIRPIFQDSDGDDNSSTRSRSSRPFQCSVDSQCGFNKKCVRRNGKSACVSLVDEDGRGVRSRGNEIQQCRRNSDCTGRRFKCDRQLKICVKK